MVWALSLSIGCERPPAPGEAAEDSAPSADQIATALDAADRYRTSGELEKAEAVLSVLIERCPDEALAFEAFGQVLVARAQVMAESGQVDAASELRNEAAEAYRAAMKLDPDSAGLAHSAGLVAMLAEQPEAALLAFLQAEKIDPSNPQHPLYAGQVFINLDDLDAAQAAIDRTLTLDADEGFAWATRAVICRQRGQQEAAEQAIAEARAIDPASPAFRLRAARIYRDGGTPERGVALLHGFSPADRLSLGLVAELAACQASLGASSEVAATWAAAFRCDEHGPEAAFFAAEAGLAWLEAGDREQADDWLLRGRQAGAATRLEYLADRLKEKDQ